MPGEPSKEGTTSNARRKPDARLTQWLARHKRFITVVSALTVLSGFLVNECLDEPIKDRLNSIAAAEQAANHSSENAGVFRQLTSVAKDVSLVRTKIVDNKTVDSQAIQLATLQASRIEILTLIGSNIAALHSQTSILPRSFRDREAIFEADYQKLLLASGTAGDQRSTEGLMRSSNEWSGMADRSRTLVGEGIQGIENLRDKCELRHRVYLWLTYVFFILGWFVGLVSNLAGGSSSAVQSES